MGIGTVLSIAAAAVLAVAHVVRSKFFINLLMRLVPNGLRPHFHRKHKGKPVPVTPPAKPEPEDADKRVTVNITSPESARMELQLMLLDHGAQVRDEIPESHYVPKLQVGPDGFGSYRYMIDGVLSLDKFHNAASAREAARQVQTIVQAHGRKFTVPVSDLNGRTGTQNGR